MRVNLLLRLLASGIVFLCWNISFGQYSVSNAFPNLAPFTKPLEMTFPEDGTNRLFVVQQGGLIYVINNSPSTSQKKVFLDLQSAIFFNNSECGLLGLAFHPDYKNNGYFYVNYTKRLNNQLTTVISRFNADASDPDVASPGSEKVILTYPQPYENHNGGCLRFGPDGYLYISSGDGGSRDDPQNNAQNLTSLLGKILRIDVNGTAVNNAYSIPTDNPFVSDANARGEIFAYGLRNPWKFDFDPVTNLLWAGDVGQDVLEEVDIIEKGKNYGWKIMEGFNCRGGTPSNCDRTGLALPVYHYNHQNANLSITGGLVYRGSKIPELVGKYVYGDYVSGRIWALDYKPDVDTTNALLFDASFTISAFAQDQSKELYAVSLGTGNIYKIEKTITTSVEYQDQEAGVLVNSIYPNPVQNEFILTIHLKDRQKANIKLLNPAGKLMGYLYDAILPSGKNVLTFDGSPLNSGIYFIEIESGSSKSTLKLIKQ